MTKEEFWEKWQPCDWPALDCDDRKKEFMADLDKVIQAEWVITGYRHYKKNNALKGCIS